VLEYYLTEAEDETDRNCNRQGTKIMLPLHTGAEFTIHKLIIGVSNRTSEPHHVY